MRFIALLLSWVFDGSTGYNHLLEVEAIDAPKSSVIVMRSLISAITILIACSGIAAELEFHRDLAYTEPADASRRLDVYAPADGQSQRRSSTAERRNDSDSQLRRSLDSKTS